jgi:hypothetical protein
MGLTAGTKLGPFEILAPLGAGGMGEVYRARDTRLGRDVAIKALPEAFARDPERLGRFEREAKLLASLSHTNIAGIHGLEVVAGQRYLILEFVDGPTLGERLKRGALPVDEALDVCRQIAAGVEAAHESGVIHRDLKPGNVKLAPGGQVKVLDFGLAKAASAGVETSALDLNASPTLTSPATGVGLILGTAAYMSPEQARGKPVDRRTDIWSFGCVLYECLSGRQLYAGETVSDVIAKILEREPDWSALPADTPPRVGQLLRRCLRKDARERLRDIGDARLELVEALAGDSGLGVSATGAASTAGAAAGIAASSTGSRWGAPRRPWNSGALRVAVVGALALLTLSTWLLLRPAPRQAALTRLSIVPETDRFFAGDPGNFALSPDGRALVFTFPDSTGVTRLSLRWLAELASHPLDGTDGASFPFWSPDSRQVGFFADGKLRRVPAAGGAIQTLCLASAGRGGAWSPGGVIVFAPEPHAALLQVSASGGVPTAATALDSARNEISHRFPSFLPDGDHFLYGTMPSASGELYNTCVAALSDPRGRPLLQAFSTATFAPPDYVVFSRDRALMAQRLKLRGVKLLGEPVLLADRPMVAGSITLSPVTSSGQSGVMAYAETDRRPTELVWLTREGRRLQVAASYPGVLIGPAIAPAGDRCAASEVAPQYRTLVFDLTAGTHTALGSQNQSIAVPAWAPDARGVACLVQADGVNRISLLDTSGNAERLLLLARREYVEPMSISPDQRTLVFTQMIPGHQRDIMFKAMGDTGSTRTYVGTPASEDLAVLSNDGRWLAYTSDGSGRNELFIDTFPQPTSPHRVSSAGVAALGGSVAWRKDDREIYFLGSGGVSLFVCDVRTQPSLTTGPPRLLQTLPSGLRGIVAAPEGDRFLALLPAGQRPTGFVIVLNWTRGLGEDK